MKRYLSCQMLSLHLLTLCFLSYILFLYYDWFLHAALFHIPGLNSMWSWCIIILMCYWSQLASILLTILTLIFISSIRQLFSCSVFGFGIRIMLSLQNVTKNIPSSQVFWKSIRKIVVNFSLIVWWYSSVKPSSFGRFYWEAFAINSISLLIMEYDQFFYVFMIPFWWGMGSRGF